MPLDKDPAIEDVRRITDATTLRALAHPVRIAFVEEAGGGKGRARPWKMSSIGMRFSNVHDDPAAQVASNALLHLVRERQIARYRTWLETQHTYPDAWREAAGDSQYVVYLTVEELEALNEELMAMLLPRFRERLTDPAQRPAGSLPVELLLFSYPIAAPEA